MVSKIHETWCTYYWWYASVWGEGYPQHSLFLACLGDFVNTCTFLLMKNGRNEMNRCVHVLAV